MTLRLHIERLVVDPAALQPGQVVQFRAALTQALGELHTPALHPPPQPRDAVGRLAARTAASIFQQAFLGRAGQS
jgi:hypothetical protein